MYEDLKQSRNANIYVVNAKISLDNYSKSSCFLKDRLIVALSGTQRDAFQAAVAVSAQDHRDVQGLSSPTALALLDTLLVIKPSTWCTVGSALDSEDQAAVV